MDLFFGRNDWHRPSSLLGAATTVLLVACINVEFTLAFSVSPAPTTTTATRTTIIHSTTFVQQQPITVRLSRTRSMANHHHHHHERLSYARSYETAAIKKTTSCLFMSLVPLAVEDVTELISVGTAPTALQYTAYWGRTPRERYNRFVECFLVSILGMVFSYCLSFVLGGFVATILGAIFLFWGVFTPQLQAVQRNWEFLGGRELADRYDDEMGGGGGGGADDASPWFGRPRGLFGALFLGRLSDVCVVEYASAPPEEEYDLIDFADYTMETDELEQYTGNPHLLRVRLEDTQGRQLQVHARLSEEYMDLEPGMEVLSLLLSKSSEFDQLAALTDIYVPATQTYIGDYPYLHREGIENLLAEDDGIWDALQQEAGFEIVGGSRNNDYSDNTNDKRRSNAAPSYGKNVEKWEPSNIYSNEDTSNDDSSSWNNPTKVPVGRRGRRNRRVRDEDDYDEDYY
mmetsp:Transcript_16414/g.21490  ORF Transcript_16414/g.21490 Transcript_16414/m.21490 type:complete len:458 (+) Transcript_16414:137-1510(+)